LVQERVPHPSQYPHKRSFSQRLRIWDPSSTTRVAWRLSRVPDSIRYRGCKQLQWSWYRNDDSNSFTRHSQVKVVSGHEQIVLQPNDKFAVMSIFLFQRMKNLNTQNEWQQWVSFGVRPQVFLTRHLSLTGDCGFDRTHLAGSYDGWLRKCTFASQIGADRKLGNSAKKPPEKSFR
jgi:maltoporin